MSLLLGARVLSIHSNVGGSAISAIKHNFFWVGCEGNSVFRDAAIPYIVKSLSYVGLEEDYFHRWLQSMYLFVCVFIFNSTFI